MDGQNRCRRNEELNRYICDCQDFWINVTDGPPRQLFVIIFQKIVLFGFYQKIGCTVCFQMLRF